MTADKVVVVGGAGFVGSHICKRLVQRGAKVVAINRSGRPAGLGSWADKVQWVKADALNPDSYASNLSDAALIVVTVGLPPIPMNVKVAIKINGDANVRPIEAAAKAGVPRLLLVGATVSPWLERFCPGYIQGKKMATDAAVTNFAGRSAVIVKPAMISGVRRVRVGPINLYIPMTLLLLPLYLLSLLRPLLLLILPLRWIQGLIEPPVSVNNIAEVAASYATYKSGITILDPSQINKAAKVAKAKR